jgi:hypothetical protein
MRYALPGLTLLAVAVCGGTTAAQAHDRYYLPPPYFVPHPPPARFVVPAPRYYYPPPRYYYAPGRVYAYPPYPRYRPYGYYRPYHLTPQGSATFFFKF